MEKMSLFQMLGWSAEKNSPLDGLDESIKELFSEITTLRHIRKQQMQTILELRNENFKLKNEIREMKEKD